MRKCIHRTTKQPFAVKIIDVAKFTSCPGLEADGESMFRTESMHTTGISFNACVMVNTIDLRMNSRGLRTEVYCLIFLVSFHRARDSLVVPISPPGVFELESM